MKNIYVVIDDAYKSSLFTVVFSSYEKALSKLIQSQVGESSCDIEIIRYALSGYWAITINDTKYTIQKFGIDERNEDND